MSEKKESRRHFLKKTAAAGILGGGIATEDAASRRVHAAGSDVISIGIIGCGGRGMGAVVDSLTAVPNTRLTAMGELFPDRAAAARDSIRESQDPSRIDVPDSRLFTGFDAYKGVIESVDLVLIACASRFHPLYAKSAIEAGKHVFVEKPHGIDALGVHSFLETAERAKEKNLAFVSGLCYRYDIWRQEAVARMKDGQIGEILSAQSDYIRTPYSLTKRQDGWTETEYQFRNWYHFTWLSGDDILQSLLHNIDSVLWAFDEVLPESAYGVGGRSTEFIPEMGDLFDHNAVVYEFPDGRVLYGFSRTARECMTSNIDLFIGSKGRCRFCGFGAPTIEDFKGNILWRPSEKERKRPMYVNEQYETVRSILDGKPINDGRRMAQSSMSAVLGTAACRSGQRVSYKELFESRFSYGPAEEEISLSMTPPIHPKADGLYPTAVPGVTPY